MRKREIYLERYGPVAGSKLYHALQSQAAHAGVSARLRRKLDAIQRGEPWPPKKTKVEDVLPLFPADDRPEGEPTPEDQAPVSATAEATEPEPVGAGV